MREGMIDKRKREREEGRGVGILTGGFCSKGTHVGGLQDHDAFIKHSACSEMEGLGAAAEQHRSKLTERGRVE
jgi:hypothetical protein